jgi:CubicO group peptidase (beta-lactamase class C family)
MAYTAPEAVGIGSAELLIIDSLVQSAIAQKAIPGAQVLVAKDENIIYHKAFGHHTYDGQQAVALHDLYDLASITKIAGALPLLMQLYEEGKFDLDATLGTYLPYYRRGNKKDITFREILAHQAGLEPWIPYWQDAFRKSGKRKRRYLNTQASKKYSVQVGDQLYLNPKFYKRIHKAIRRSETGEKKYLYSGLVFYLFPEIIEKITGEDYNTLLRSRLYDPLGAGTLTYFPQKFDKSRIVPTEYDSVFRKQQIHGAVHDEGAALMPGSSSNAGLFSNANDLAKLMQMYANLGVYGGRRYLKEETLREFSRCQYCAEGNRRGLGFDRPPATPSNNGNTARSASPVSFGHSGFTGTFTWADPEHNLVYVFLSNRVYPTRENNKLFRLNTRTNILQAVYDALPRD